MAGSSVYSAAIVASVMSNTSGAIDRNALSATFAHSFDLDSRSYYVVVELYRPSSFRQARLRAVRLIDSSP